AQRRALGPGQVYDSDTTKLVESPNPVEYSWVIAAVESRSQAETRLPKALPSTGGLEASWHPSDSAMARTGTRRRRRGFIAPDCQGASGRSGTAPSAALCRARAAPARA